MKISIETKQIELEFPSGNKYFVELDLKSSTFTWKCDLNDLPNNILRLRTHASELMQIATLVKDQLNMVNGYEFNEEVEPTKKDTFSK